MARTRERYLVGPGLANKLRDIVSRFDDSPIGGGSSASIPVRLQDSGRLPVAIRLCKTNAAFNKGTVATLNVWEDGTPPNETQTAGATIENVVNKFADIAANKWAIVSRAPNGYWYLIAAEC